MGKLPNAVWSGFKKRMSSTAFTFVGRRVGIEEIPRAEGELGYTSKNGAIHLSRDNTVLDTIPTEAESVSLVTGVFSHELMHQLITNFPEFERVLRSLSPAQAEIFKIIYNVMEDPACENQAKYYIGGYLLSCLHYSIMTLYKLAPPLRKKDSPFSQFVNALIMYGDGGFVKGKFYSAKARKMFYKVLPVVDKNIDEPDSKKRVQNAYEVFLLTKPLWEEDAKKTDELLNELKQNMAERGKTLSGSCGNAPVNPERNDDASDPIADKKKKRRKITYRKVSKEELEEMKKSGAAGEDDGESDIEVLYCDEDEGKDVSAGSSSGVPAPPTKPQSGSGGEEAAGKGKNASGENAAEKGSEEPSGGAESAGLSSESGETGEKSKSKENEGAFDGDEDDGEDAGGSSGEDSFSSENSDDENEEAGTANSSDDASEEGGGAGVEGGDVDYSKEEVIDDIEYELTPEDISRAKDMLRDFKEEEAAVKRERDMCHSESLDVPALKTNYSGVSCLNKRIKCSLNAALEDAYNKVIDKFSLSINRLTNQMKRIIVNDREERAYRASGKVYVPRLCGGRMTTSVFRRNLDPANKADMCVLFLVDESGSMVSGNKYVHARECAVCIAEVLSRLHIPLKVIGFTADIEGYDVVHNHYMHWLNTFEERVNLTSITHRCNNFDGYSIRYATEMLCKRPEEHKLLVVLSDGQPAARYYTRNTGISDTTDAINCAKKKVDVIGVGVGSAGEKVWKAMYGDSFLHVKDANDLLSKIGGEIQKIMKRW